MSENKEEEEALSEESKPPEPRAIGVFSDINEKKAEDIVYALKLYAADSNEDIEFYISTSGGSASDMFAIYDFMRATREELDIVTYGLGKVMSAGILLLAAGTKGKRKIGKYCRVMIHSVIGGNVGPLHDLENEMSEIKQIQNMYTEALCSETKITKKQIKVFFAKNVNVYLSAEEAVKYGIADIIV